MQHLTCHWPIGMCKKYNDFDLFHSTQVPTVSSWFTFAFKLICFPLFDILILQGTGTSVMMLTKLTLDHFISTTIANGLFIELVQY
jgi:hypothetical protein